MIYLDSDPVFYIIDSSIVFSTNYFLKDIKAYIVWEVFKRYWFNTYLRPLNVILVNVGTNFIATKFKTEVRLIGITVY